MFFKKIRNLLGGYGFVFVSIALAFFLPQIFLRGFMLHDEGYILHAAQRINDGEVIYKDFFIAYTPLTPLITSSSFLIFGESVASGRLIAMIASIITIYFIYEISQQTVKNKIIGLGSVLFFIIWGPIQINFSWPIVYTTLTGLITCYSILRSNRYQSKLNYFSIGLFASLTLLFKQNFGIAAISIMIIYFLLNKDKIYLKSTISALLGFVTPLVIWAIYIISTGSEAGVVENFYVQFFQLVVVKGAERTAFLYYGQPLIVISKLIFYLIPLIISLTASILVWKKNKKFVYIPLFTSLYYLLGIRPVTDFVHYTYLLAISGLPLLMIFSLSKNTLMRVSFLTLFTLLTVLGIYMSLFKGYYKWESPILMHHNFVNDKRVKVLVDDKYKNLIKDTTKYISSKTNKGDYIYINHYLPALYFITERKNPTHFIYLSSNLNDDHYEQEIIKNIKDKKVKLIITLPLSKNDNSLLTQFIRRNYGLDKSLYGYAFWFKK